MTRISTLDYWCVFSIWVMALAYSSAERQYFPQHTNATWISARSYCQNCYKELVTVTPENVQSIVQNLFSVYWIGLRKRPVNASVNSSLYSFKDTTMFWSRWANGDPLTFQNWYPGHPVFKSPYPRRDCCSCSCTCPVPPTTRPTTVTTQNVTHNVTYNTTASTQNVTMPFSTAAPYTPLDSQCVKTPILFQDVPDPDENYIEDPCVAMLSFGAWVEKDCWESRPFICYEDRFYGQISVTNITSTSANLTWESGPGNITHYRVEVNGPNNTLNLSNLTTELTSCHLQNLTSGTFYSAQVFPVKCGRDLNPENATFYTVPDKVSELQVVNQTEGCVSLSWTRPSGNVDLYIVNTSVEGLPKYTETKTEEVTVCNLTPGQLHNFSVQSGVKDKSHWSDPSTVSAYTKPAKVSNLQTKDINDTSLLLTWDKPTGNATGYLVKYFWNNGTQEVKVDKTELKITGLPSGTKITLSVIALANDSLKGDSQTVFNYTSSRPVTDLKLSPSTGKIFAEWKYPEGSLNFIAQLYLGNELISNQSVGNKTNTMFDGLMNSAEYTVSVFSVSGETKSPRVNRSEFTPPLPPTDVKPGEKNKTHLTFTWKPPQNTTTANYSVTLNSSFWGQQWKEVLFNKTTHTFSGLTSGTNYTFQVQTMSGTKNNLSEAVMCISATDAAKREITLSMVCSSSQSLSCDGEQTRETAFQELKSKFEGLLGDHVFWKLERMESANTGK